MEIGPSTNEIWIYVTMAEAVCAMNEHAEILEMSSINII